MSFRRLAGVALLLACLAAYWTHFGNRFASIEAETALQDSGKVLSDAEKSRLKDLRAVLREEFGVSVRLVVHTESEPDAVPRVAGNGMYMAITPATGKASVVLPTLMERALVPDLGPQPAERLAEKLLVCTGTKGLSVGACLEDALVSALGALGMKELESPAMSSISKQAATPNQGVRHNSSVHGPLNKALPTDTSAERATP